MSLVRMACNSLLPLKENEQRIGRDTAEVLFTKSYVATLSSDEYGGIDFQRVAIDLSNPEIINRAKRVEQVSRPISATIFTALAVSAAFISFNVVKDFPEGTYNIGRLTIRTGDAVNDLPPMCETVEESYFDRGFSMKRLGELSVLEESLPIANSCRKFEEVYVFVSTDG